MKVNTTFRSLCVCTALSVHTHTRLKTLLAFVGCPRHIHIHTYTLNTHLHVDFLLIRLVWGLGLSMLGTVFFGGCIPVRPCMCFCEATRPLLSLPCLVAFAVALCACAWACAWACVCFCSLSPLSREGGHSADERKVMEFELPDVAAYTKKRYDTSFFDPQVAHAKCLARSFSLPLPPHPLFPSLSLSLSYVYACVYLFTPQ